MGDERDETLNGYDSLIQSFDLEPPDGFSSMDDFNAELNAWLDRVHPATREYLNQSLRGGTQTPDQLFGAGHDAGGEDPRRASTRRSAAISPNMTRRRPASLPVAAGAGLSAMPAPGRHACAIAAFTSTISIPKAGSAPATMSPCPRRWRMPARGRAGSSSANPAWMCR